MTEPSPYTTPGARVEDLPEPLNRRFRWKAVVLGAATDLGCSAVAGIVLFMLFSWWIADGSSTTNERLAQLGAHWPFLMLSMIVGAGFTVLGGYVAGRIAKHAFLKHALAAGVLSLVLGIVLFHQENGPYAGLMALMGYGLHIPLALLGGWVAQRQAGGETAA